LPRKDPLTRKEVLELLEAKVCEITYSPPGSSRRTVRVTLLHEWIKELDNFPEGFETNREAALFDLHSINCLDVDNNQWITIQISRISKIIAP
jgi:Fe-S-cluster formation regulator IscX/YfhJ